MEIRLNWTTVRTLSSGQYKPDPIHTHLLIITPTIGICMYVDYGRYDQLVTKLSLSLRLTSPTCTYMAMGYIHEVIIIPLNLQTFTFIV